MSSQHSTEMSVNGNGDMLNRWMQLSTLRTTMEEFGALESLKSKCGPGSYGIASEPGRLSGDASTFPSVGDLRLPSTTAPVSQRDLIEESPVEVRHEMDIQDSISALDLFPRGSPPAVDQTMGMIGATPMAGNEANGLFELVNTMSNIKNTEGFHTGGDFLNSEYSRRFEPMTGRQASHAETYIPDDVMGALIVQLNIERCKVADVCERIAGLRNHVLALQDAVEQRDSRIDDLRTRMIELKKSSWVALKDSSRKLFLERERFAVEMDGTYDLAFTDCWTAFSGRFFVSWSKRAWVVWSVVSHMLCACVAVAGYVYFSRSGKLDLLVPS